MLDTTSPNQRILEILDDALVNTVTKVFNGTLTTTKDDWLSVIGKLTFGFGVDATEIEVLPH